MPANAIAATPANASTPRIPKEQGYPRSLRHFAIKLYLEGNSLRAIARLLGVHPQTVVSLEALKRAVWLFVYAYNTRQWKQRASGVPIPSN